MSNMIHSFYDRQRHFFCMNCKKSFSVPITRKSFILLENLPLVGKLFKKTIVCTYCKKSFVINDPAFFF